MLSRNVKSAKEIFLPYSTQSVFSTITLVSGNVVMVTIDMCRKSPITREWIYGITWKHVHFNIFVLFIVDTTSILTLVFPTIYYFCLDGYIGGCVVAIIVTVVVVFIYLFYLFILFFVYLFIFSAASTVILILLLLLSSLLLLLLLESLLPFVRVGLLLLLI